MLPKFELRWLITPGWDGPEKVLQYRYMIEGPDYGRLDPLTGLPVTEQRWSDWTYVPTIKEV